MFAFLQMHSQVYYYECESKLKRQIVSERWQEVLKIKDQKFSLCEKLPNSDTCSYKTSYAYRLKKDTIFIVGINAKNDTIIHPQYSLRKQDSLLFLTESIDGFENGSTEGYVRFIKDTVLKVNKKKWCCYLFRRMNENRETTEMEFIFLHQTTFVPIKNEVKYYDKDKQEIFSAYKKKVLKKVAKK